MSRNLNDLGRWIADIVRRIERLESGAKLEHSSITNGALRVLSNEGLIVEGSAKVGGWLVVTGTGRVVGRLEGTGTLDWTGPAFLRGASRIEGDLDVTGLTRLAGAVTLNSDLTLGSGRVLAGPLSIDRNGSYGGRLASTGYLLLDAGTAVILGASTTVQGGLTAVGLITGTSIQSLGNISALGSLDVLGAKNFKTPHPTKPGHWLRHGSTESPVSGIEYWGDARIGADGTARVTLPEYFEELAKPAGRVVLVTGRGYAPDWSDIDDGSFTVTGKPGGRFSWLVKAERFGGDFPLEEKDTDEPVASAWTPPTPEGATDG